MILGCRLVAVIWQLYTGRIPVYTPYSKRKYTLRFLEHIQNVGGAGPTTGWRGSQSEFCNNQAWICDKIPSGSKVRGKSLLRSYVRKFTKSAIERHRLLCYWLTKWITNLNFLRNSVLFGVGLQRAVAQTMLWVLHDLGLVWLLIETQSVYFLLELSVVVKSLRIIDNRVSFLSRYLESHGFSI